MELIRLEKTIWDFMPFCLIPVPFNLSLLFLGILQNNKTDRLP